MIIYGKRKKTILIVEDEPTVRRALSDKFGREGFTFLEAPDGEAGLALALKEHPDVILLDIIMPRMDGITMLKHLRNDAWGKDAHVIILTNLSDATKVSQAAERGVYDFLVKSDWKLADVVRKVKKHLG